MADATSSDRDTPTSLYLYYDRLDVLLYVGITARGMQRNREHNGTKAWWEYVTRQEVEHFPTYDAAHAREIALIERHTPPFNVQHNPQHRQMREAYRTVLELPVEAFDGTQLLAATGGWLPVWLDKPRADSNKRRVWFAPQHIAITSRLNMSPTKRPPVLIGDHGEMVGRVTDLHRAGPFVTGGIHLPRDDRWPSEALAYVKNACVKGPAQFRLARLQIDKPDEIFLRKRRAA